MRIPSSTFINLLIDAQNGTESAIESLILMYSPMLTKMANKTYLDKEDCKQVLMISFFNAIPKFNFEIAVELFLNEFNK